MRLGAEDTCKCCELGAWAFVLNSVHECLVCIYTHTWCHGKGCQTLWEWSYRWLRSIMWLLGTELGSSLRAATVLNQWALRLVHCWFGFDSVPSRWARRRRANYFIGYELWSNCVLTSPIILSCLMLPGLAWDSLSIEDDLELPILVPPPP